MPQEDFFWIALPNGLDQGRARISALLVPRLIPDDEDATLREFGFAQWPKRVTTARFECRVGDVALEAVRVEQQLDEQAFELLFPQETPVRRSAADRALGVYNSYPAAVIAEHAREMHAETVPLPRGLRRDRVASLESSFAELRARRADLRMQLALRLLQEEADKPAVAEELTTLALADERADEPVPVIPRDSSVGAAYLQFAMFHQPLNDMTASSEVSKRPVLDFAQRVASLSEYPALLRRLGLLVDLEVDASRLPAEGLLAVVMVGGDGTKPAPATQYRFDATSFAAMTRGDALANGFVNVADGRYTLADFDVDAAGWNVLLHGSDEELLELRSVGLSVLEGERARGLLSAANRLQDEIARRERSEASVLFAEDLVRGFRVDVQEGTEWRSLHVRNGKYRLGDEVRLEAIDEGMVVPAVTQFKRSASAVTNASHDETTTDYVAEALFLWNGWSLSAPRPGTPMAETVPLDQTGMPLRVEFAPGERSLPRLRFGKEYRVRLRAADLAGNGLRLEDANQVTQAPVLPAKDVWRCLRYESLPAPRFREDATEVVVLRAGVDAEAEQVLAPPVVSQLMAEQCGKFDAAFGTDRQAAAVYAMAAAENLPDPFAAGLAIVNCPGVRAGIVARFGPSGLVEEPLALGDEFVPPETSVLLLDFDQRQWPQVPEFRLRLEAGEGAPTLDDNVLTVRLPAAMVSHVEVSSRVAAEVLDLMAYLRLASERLQRDVKEGLLDEAEFVAHEAQMRRAAQLGVLRRMTPSKTLRLVHAVQRPLVAPRVTQFDAPERLSGRTVAWLGMRVEYDVQSTARLEVVARWKEAESEVEQAAVPLTFAAQASGVLHVPGFAVRGREEAVRTKLRAAQETLGKVNRISGGAVDPAMRRLLAADKRLPLHANLDEVIDAADDAEAGAQQMEIQGQGSDLPGEPPPNLPLLRAALLARDDAQDLRDEALTFKSAINGPLPKGQEFGDTKHRMVSYTVRAVSRFADYFPDADVAVESIVQQAVVKSAARPAPPRVRRIVPTFEWKRSTDGAFTSERRTGLRAYLEGPWYESGAGEMLAVLLGSSKGATRWAFDPVFESGSLGRQPDHTHFANTAFVSEAMETEVFVAYRVQRDEHGYFADVDLAAAAAYMPFVQLGLARFQPNALRGLELSEPVMAAPVQLMPKRVLFAVRESPVTVELKVSGVAPRVDPSTLFRARVQTKLPGEMPGEIDDALWLSEAPLATEQLATDSRDLWRVRIPFVAAADRRLLVEELEVLPNVSFDGVTRTVERLVFAEVVAI